MTHSRMLCLATLLAAGVACLASPALAGSYSNTPWNPWLEPWTCTAFEYAHKCNALWHPRSARCGCMGLNDMGWRLNEYYGPRARNLAPHDVSQ